MVTVPDGLWVDNATSASEFRKALGALVAAAGPTWTRPGRLPGPGTPLTVAPTAPASRSVLVSAGKAVLNRSDTYGPVLGVGPDGDVTIDCGSAPDSGSVYRLIYLAQRDASYPTQDADSLAVVDVVSGDASATPVRPTLPDGALLLGEVLDSAGAATITAAMVTDLPTWTSVRGAPVPVANAAARAALPVWPGLQALEADTGALVRYDGGKWRYDGDRLVVTNKAARLALSAYPGLEAIESDTGYRLYYDGTKWRYDGDRVVVANAAARNALTGYAGLNCRLADTLKQYYYSGSAWVLDEQTLSGSGAPLASYLTADGTAASAGGTATFLTLTGVQPGTYAVDIGLKVNNALSPGGLTLGGSSASGRLVLVGVTSSGSAGTVGTVMQVGVSVVSPVVDTFRIGGVITITAATAITLTGYASNFGAQAKAGSYITLTKLT